MKKQMSLPVAVTIILLVLGVTLWGRFDLSQKGKLPQEEYITHSTTTRVHVSSFADCKAAGYPILESYPEVCVAPGNDRFINRDQSIVVDPVIPEYGTAHFTPPDGTYLVSLTNVIYSPEGDTIVIGNQMTTNKDDYCAKNDTDCWDFQEYGPAAHPVVPRHAGLRVNDTTVVTFLNYEDGATEPSTTLTWQEFLTALWEGKPNPHGYYSVVDENFVMHEEMVYAYSPYEITVKNGLVTNITQVYND